jgi:hypothetical protein
MSHTVTSASTTLSVAIVTGGFTFMAAALGILGTGLLQWRSRLRADRAERDRQVAEVLTAADDLYNAVSNYREFGSPTGVNTLFRLLVIVIETVASFADEIFASGDDDISNDLVGKIGFSLLAKAVRSEDTGFERHSIRYTEVIMPVQERLTAALGPLRVSADMRIAAAARELGDKATLFAVNAIVFKRSYNRNRREFDDSVKNFATIANRTSVSQGRSVYPQGVMAPPAIQTLRTQAIRPALPKGRTKVNGRWLIIPRYTNRSSTMPRLPSCLAFVPTRAGAVVARVPSAS